MFQISYQMRSSSILPISLMEMVTEAIRLKLMVARNALNMFELSFSLAMTAHQKNEVLTVDTLRPLLLRTQIVYDRAGDKHYDTISAFIKSMRGSDPDAAVYYLARMIKGGEDPLFVARRMVIFASEDVGLVSRSSNQVLI